MLSTIRSFMDAHQLADVTIVADAGVVSAANQKAIEEAGLSFILGARISDVRTAVEGQLTPCAASVGNPTGVRFATSGGA